MNKAKAYRELQKKQSRLRKIWSETHTSSVSTQDKVKYEQQLDKLMSTAMDHFCRSNVNETLKRPGQDKQGTMNGERPLSRAKATRVQFIYSDPNRPVTAPEMNVYSSLDGPRYEVKVRPIHGPQPNQRATISDTESLPGYPVMPLPYQPASKPQLVRQSHEAAQVLKDMREELLIEQCKEDDSIVLRGDDDNAGGQETIQYPSASNMRMWLSSSGQTLAVNENNKRNNIKKGVMPSQRLGRTQNGLERERTAGAQHQRPQIPPYTRKANHFLKQSAIRKIATAKQVSFGDFNDENGRGQPAALTAKNLDLYNAMVLKTIRTSKFDERVVKWVMERQIDPQTKSLHKDSALDSDERSRDFTRLESFGRPTTPGWKTDTSMNRSTAKTPDLKVKPETTNFAYSIHEKAETNHSEVFKQPAAGAELTTNSDTELLSTASRNNR